MVQLDPNEPAPMTAERAVRKLINQLRLPEFFHALWIRNEWDGDQVRHIIMCGMRRLPRGAPPPNIPDTFEGYEVRKIKLLPDGTAQAPMHIATPLVTVDKH